MKISDLRKKIDRIDSKIVSLLNQRANEAIKIGKLKKDMNYGLFSPDREAMLLKRVKNISKGLLKKEDIEAIFKEILSVCRSLRVILKVAYLGPEGTFTHLAAVKKFGKKSQYVAADSIQDIFDKVEVSEADYGIVPIENSIEGVVNYTLDVFYQSSLKICSEVVLDIKHALLGRSEKRVRRIYSNPQVFSQCRNWIRRNFPNAELVPSSSTAKAAYLAKKDSWGACIGNKILADLYSLNIVASSIEDSIRNRTRFLVVSKDDSLPSGNDKTSVLFSVKDKVGALYDVLASFNKYGINLTKIESRPSKIKPWEYYFFADFKGHRNNNSIRKALEELRNHCLFVKVLGSYPKES